MGKKLSLKINKFVSVKIKRKYLYIIAFLALMTTVLSFLLSFFVYYTGRFYPQTYINTFNLENLTKEEALTAISKNPVPELLSIKVDGTGGGQVIEIPLSSLGASIDFIKTIENAYKQSKSNGPRGFFENKFYNFEITYDDDLLDEQLSLVVSQVPNPPEDPSLVYSPGGVTVKPGVAGYLLNQEKLKERVLQSMRAGKWDLQVTVELSDSRLTPAEETLYLGRGKALSSKTLTLTSPEKEFVYDSQELLDFLNPRGGYSFGTVSPGVADIKLAVKTPPQNPVFTFENGRVNEFSPAKDGLEVNESELIANVSNALGELENTNTDSVVVEIPLTRTPPDFKTEDVNNLGIKELIGTGTSFFKGSTSSRIHNISLASSRLNGVLIPPGEVFSFTKALGDISVYTGYQQAYVIQGNQTVLGDGGGVCQVSTTFFRAVLNAGLPIIERHAHSYRVGYYEQDSPPGIDATIYSPTVDIKIKNDTPGHILIQTTVDKSNSSLKFELYGTSDGRVATISKPVVSQVVAPPEDLYIDDPTLPAGQIKQIDYKAWGAKVSFNYSVERNGQIIFEDTFNSNYRPWQAKFLRGTGPAQ